MKPLIAAAALAALALAGAASAADKPKTTAPKTTAEVLAAATADEWRPLALDRTLVMTFKGGRQAILELAPEFAPNTVAQILAFARAHYYDGLAITRVQDNFVTQWGDPNAEASPKSKGSAAKTIAPEWTRPLKGLPFTRLQGRDVYAPMVGFENGLPMATDGRTAWLAHCYGMVGVGRDSPPESGDGSELYVVIGQSPRQLDKNITVVGRVVQGMDFLSALPRGPAPLGVYEDKSLQTPIESVVVASDLPGGGPAGKLELLRSDSKSFSALIEARRNRRDDWYKVPAGALDVCNVMLPVRAKP